MDKAVQRRGLRPTILPFCCCSRCRSMVLQDNSECQPWKRWNGHREAGEKCRRALSSETDVCVSHKSMEREDLNARELSHQRRHYIGTIGSRCIYRSSPQVHLAMGSMPLSQKRMYQSLFIRPCRMCFLGEESEKKEKGNPDTGSHVLHDRTFAFRTSHGSRGRVCVHPARTHKHRRQRGFHSCKRSYGGHRNDRGSLHNRRMGDRRLFSNGHKDIRHGRSLHHPRCLRALRR